MFNWEDYKKVADELIRSSDTELAEALERTAISRAYYAGFHAAHQFAADKKFFCKKKGVGLHASLVASFKTYAVQHEEQQYSLSQIALRLEQTRRMRVVSDYRADQLVGQQDAIQACKRVEGLCREVRYLTQMS